MFPRQILYYFVTHGSVNDKCEIKIMLNGIVLEQVKCAKFLGVYIDEHLSWDNHIQEVACKVSRNVGILGKLKFTLPKHVCYCFIIH